MLEGMPVASGPGSVVNATVLNGQTTSAAVDLGNKRLARIDTPNAVDGTTITFLVSADNATYVPLYGDDGTQYTVTMAASRGIAVDLAKFASVRYLKLVTAASTADRTFTLSTIA